MRTEFIEAAYGQYAEELMRYLRGTSFYSAEEARDIVQIAFVRLAGLAAPEDIANVRGFLYKTVKRIAIDQTRRRQTQDRYIRQQLDEREAEPFTEHSPEHIALHRERLKLIETVIMKLPPRRRRVFILSRIHSLSYDEIAEKTGLSKEGVRKHIARAMAACEQALHDREATE